MCSNLSGNILHVASAGLHLSSSSSCCEYLYWVLRAEASGVCVCTRMSMNYYLFVSVSVCVCVCKCVPMHIMSAYAVGAMVIVIHS